MNRIDPITERPSTFSCDIAYSESPTAWRAATSPELLSRYAEAGCQRVYLWPLGDEPRQIERIADAVAPAIRPTP